MRLKYYSPNDAWDSLVGYQTSKEFMNESFHRKKRFNFPFSSKQIEKAVKTYVKKDIPKAFPEYQIQGNEEELLIKKVLDDCKKYTLKKKCKFD